MKTTVTVKAYFNAAHRIAGSDIPCEALHGHSSEVYFTLAAKELQGGMIVEFEDAQARVQQWLSKNWDHNVILAESDRELGEAISRVTKQKIFYYPGIPTSENLAAYLLNEIAPKLFAGTNGKCISVKLVEFSKSEYSCEVSL